MIQANFTAELHCQHGQVGVVDTPLYVHPLFSLDQDGWLCTEHQRGDSPSFKPITFAFRFLKHQGERTHYAINGAETWEYFGSSLERNRNGWVGFYATHIVGRIIGNANLAEAFYEAIEGKGQWKIETLSPWDGRLETAEEVPFYLRDLNGYRVALARSTYTRDKVKRHYWFLNASTKEGEILVFNLKNIKPA
ncbi:hypothetical protein CXG50_23760 [Pseudomonas plecoglossicida]|jgi:hypothetical protein|uniref:Uncharacterized protein n=4 Tax=Pseudomonas TaxID=286 RepID=A0ABX4TWP1_PSEDL|nr:MULTISPECIES: hypothetical protein [Pseudomonas]TXI07319.1 MAG: hypothetical protein E6Q70_05715 [Pseudomonas monteilii]GJB78949.1 hypothetical protein KAM380_034140 [Aeromonas caviae]AGA74670.1 hypothetical protein B479_18890 [Pseudomonas putida HB3267]KPM65397.1 hypothetical protein HB13667_11725 [Pseudomonas putida]KYC22910.1 hypothetical protein WM94_11640 [Pseudomonas sp. ABFPK]